MGRQLSINLKKQNYGLPDENSCRYNHNVLATAPNFIVISVPRATGGFAALQKSIID